MFSNSLNKKQLNEDSEVDISDTGDSEIDITDSDEEKYETKTKVEKVKKKRGPKVEKETCNICVSNITKLNKKVMCLYCNFEICTSCVKKYLLDKVECMNCKKEWSNDFIQNNTTISWFNNEYKNKRKENLFEREKSLLQTAYPQLKAKRLEIKWKNDKKEIERQIEELQNKKMNLDLMYRHNSQRVLQGLEEQESEELENLNAEEKENYLKSKGNRQVKFIKACPVVNCKGFLSTQYKCELCDTYVCKNCFELKKEKNDETHVCDENLVKTIQELLKSSKPCPKCGQGIQKIEGCKHMFCAACKTCFNWDTGDIMKSNSNPEYNKWVAMNRKNQITQNNTNITNCGIVLNEQKYNILLKKLNISTTFLLNKYHYHNVFSINVYNQHIREVLIPIYRINHLDQDMLKLRVKYLLNEISDDEWKKQILTKERKNEYNNSIHNLLDLVLNVSQSFIIKMSECNFNTLEDFEDAWNEFYNVIEYFNTNCKDITKKYSYNKYFEIKILYTDDDCNKPILEYMLSSSGITPNSYNYSYYLNKYKKGERDYRYITDLRKEFHNTKKVSPYNRNNVSRNFNRSLNFNA